MTVYDAENGSGLVNGQRFPWLGLRDKPVQNAPAGVSRMFRSSTELAAFCPRVFLEDTAEDRIAIQPVLNQIVAYPLSQFDGRMKTKDWKKVPNFPAPGQQGQGEIRWVNPETYFDQLPAVLNRVPPLPDEEATYTMIRSVLDAAAKDAQVRQTLKETAVASEKELISPLFQWRFNGPPAGNGWYSLSTTGRSALTTRFAPAFPSRTCTRTDSMKRSPSLRTSIQRERN